MKVRCTSYNLMKVQLCRKNENKIFVQCCRYKYATFFTTNLRIYYKTHRDK